MFCASPRRCCPSRPLTVVVWLLILLVGSPAWAQVPQFSADEAAAVATDRFALEELRVQAINLLADHRTQRIATVLMDLTAVGEPPQVRAAAFSALERMTSVIDIGADEAGWRDWWQQHRDLPAEVWYQTLLNNFSRRNADLTARHNWAQDRLIEAQRLIYESIASAERPAKLMVMLDDPLEAIRLQGLELAHRRLVEGEPPGPDLIASVRARLEDDSPAMRRRAALLLRDVGDAEAADILARRLVVGTEKDVDALRAYLLLLTQTPRSEAVVAALDMLADPRFNAEAAGMLAAAADRQLLQSRQAEQAGRLCRELVRDGRLPQPQVIALLGLIGNDADWVRIEQWLDSANEAVKEAAALAWGKSDRPLLPLVQRATDPVIRPNALVAAGRRGHDAATLMALIDSRLEQDPRQREWEDALVAMAGRVEPQGVLQAEQELARIGQPLPLRERLITAAIDAQGVAPVQRDGMLVELLLLRAQIKLESEDYQGAVVDYKRLADLGAALDARQQRRHDRGLLRAQLAVGYIDGAVEVARRMLTAPARPVEADTIAFIVETFSRAIERDLQGSSVARAGQALAALRSLLGNPVPDTYRAQIDALESRIRQIER